MWLAPIEVPLYFYRTVVNLWRSLPHFLGLGYRFTFQRPQAHLLRPIVSTASTVLQNHVRFGGSWWLKQAETRKCISDSSLRLVCFHGPLLIKLSAAPKGLMVPVWSVSSYHFRLDTVNGPQSEAVNNQDPGIAVLPIRCRPSPAVSVVCSLTWCSTDKAHVWLLVFC